MSLFSRLDRLRTRDSQTDATEKAEDGLFTVPDLSPARDAGQVPPPAVAEATADARAEIQGVTFAPVDLSAAGADEISAKTETSAPPLDRLKGAARADNGPKFAPVSLDLGAPSPVVDDENAKPSMFAAAPFKLPDLSQIAADVPDESEAAPAVVEAEASEPEVEAAQEIDPAASDVASAPPVAEAPVAEAPATEVPATEAPVAEAPATEAPAKSALSPFERLMAARAAQTDAPPAPRVAAETPPTVTPTPKSPPLVAQTEAPPAKSEMQSPDLPLESANGESANDAAVTSQSPVSAPIAESDEEAEISAAVTAVETPRSQDLEDEISSHESPSAEPSSDEPPPDEPPPARTALSLADRLAKAPRAELESAHAEAQELAPEVLSEAAPKLPVPAPFVPTTAPAEQPTPAPSPQIIMSAPPETSPADAKPRSFSERLAARTGLDRHLQVPAEIASEAESLAPSHTELARIDEGAQLSEREMKNRVLYRQKHLIFDSVIGALDPRALQNPTKESLKPAIERAVDGALREFNLDIDPFERNWMVDEFVRETTDLGALVPLLEDPTVTKIIVTGAQDVSVEKLGRIERSGVTFRDDDHLLSLVRKIAEMSGGRVDAKVPLLDRPLPDGGRIRAKVPPLAPQPTLTIEKSTGNPFVALKRQQADRARGEALPYAQLRERIQQKLLREFEGDAAALAGNQDKLRGQVEEMIGAVISEERVVVTRAERASLVMDLLNEIVGLGPIEPLLNDPDVDEVMVNGPYQIYVERKGKLELTSQRFRDNGHVMQVIDRIVAPLGRRVDEKSPMVDGRLRDGSRFNAIIPPLALSGPTMTIRKFARDPFTMSDLINFGSMSREAAQFLQAAVEGRLNIVVSGGTGSGKTTTLNVLSSFIPSTERIVTIEDAAELQMRQEHVIRMETRPPNIEGVGEIGIRDLVRNSLRMRPDRIVVGECRGGEALDMLQAMNTGHDGSLTTAHSNGPRDTLKRLETMVMMAGFDLPIKAIREQIAMAVQLIVHQERMRDGKRRVTAITEIVGMEGDVVTMQDIFRFEQERIDEDGRIHGALQATGMRPKHYETIVDNGVELPMDLFHPRPVGEGARTRLAERTSAR